MINLNPLEKLIEVEYGRGEFKEIGVIGSFVISFLYIFFLQIFLFIALMPIKNIFIALIFNISSILAIFIIISKYCLPDFYELSNDKQENSSTYINKVTYHNIIFLSLSIIGFKLFFDSSIVYFFKDTSSFNFFKEAFTFMGKNPLILVLYGIILGPAMEEIVFRGAILNGLLKKYSTKVAILVSSLVFGIIHFNDFQFWMAFLLGIFLSILYIKTHSIFLCMFAHSLHNLYSEITLLYIPKYFSLINFNIPMVILFFILGLSIMVLSFKKISHGGEAIYG